MAQVVVQRELDGTYTVKVSDNGANLTIVDLAVLDADDTELLRKVNQLITLGTTQSFAYARELINRLETKLTPTP